MELEKIDKIEHFKDVRSKLMDLLEVFPSEKVEDELFDGLSIKQLMLNITLAEMFTIALLEDVREGRDVTWEDPYEFTDPLVHPDSEWEDLFEDLTMAGQNLLQTLELFPTHLWEKPIWKDKDLTPAKLLHIDTNHYKDFYLFEIVKHVPDDYVY